MTNLHLTNLVCNINNHLLARKKKITIRYSKFIYFFLFSLLKYKYFVVKTFYCDIKNIVVYLNIVSIRLVLFSKPSIYHYYKYKVISKLLFRRMLFSTNLGLLNSYDSIINKTGGILLVEINERLQKKNFF